MPNSDLKVLGEKVRKERKLAGLTQEQLAERCHVSTKHIANIEKGSMNPSYEILWVSDPLFKIQSPNATTDKMAAERSTFPNVIFIPHSKSPTR